jgi:hypothetical protein
MLKLHALPQFPTWMEGTAVSSFVYVDRSSAYKAVGASNSNMMGTVLARDLEDLGMPNNLEAVLTSVVWPADPGTARNTSATSDNTTAWVPTALGPPAQERARMAVTLFYACWKKLFQRGPWPWAVLFFSHARCWTLSKTVQIRSGRRPKNAE